MIFKENIHPCTDLNKVFELFTQWKKLVNNFRELWMLENKGSISVQSHPLLLIL